MDVSEHKIRAIVRNNQTQTCTQRSNLIVDVSTPDPLPTQEQSTGLPSKVPQPSGSSPLSHWREQTNPPVRKITETRAPPFLPSPEIPKRAQTTVISFSQRISGAVWHTSALPYFAGAITPSPPNNSATRASTTAVAVADPGPSAVTLQSIL